MAWKDKDGKVHEAEYDDEDAEQEAIVGDLVAQFTPDFNLSEEGLFNDETAPDVLAFTNAQYQNLVVFLKARMEHGNHLDNPEWYDRAELACKCWRYIKAWTNGDMPSHEEMVDLANYSTMINSRRQGEPENKDE